MKLDPIMSAVAAAMREQSVSTAELARRVAPTPTRAYVYRCLSGQQVPTTPIASRFIAVLGLSVVPVAPRMKKPRR